MSRPSHAVSDFLVNGRTHHADCFGSYHDGPSANCETCRVEGFRRLRGTAAYEKATAATATTTPAVQRTLPCDARTPSQVVADINALLARPKPNHWPLVGGFALGVGFVLLVLGVIELALWL